MSYRVTHLWSVLEKDERSLRWLARHTGYTHNYFSQLRSGRRQAVSEECARRISETLRLPVEAIFECNEPADN